MSARASNSNANKKRNRMPDLIGVAVKMSRERRVAAKSHLLWVALRFFISYSYSLVFPFLGGVRRG
jgi:hypothetical protein